MFDWIKNSFDTVARLADDAPFQSEDFINKIFPNGFWDLIIQLLAFVALLVFVFFIGYKPVKKMVAKRREHVANEIAEAEAANKVAQDAAAKSAALIDEGKAQAQAILTKAIAQGEAEKARLLEEADIEIASRKKAADDDIALAKEKSKDEVRDEIVNVALLASEQLLGRSVEDEDHKRMVSSFVDDLKRE